MTALHGIDSGWVFITLLDAVAAHRPETDMEAEVAALLEAAGAANAKAVAEAEQKLALKVGVGVSVGGGRGWGGGNKSTVKVSWISSHRMLLLLLQHTPHGVCCVAAGQHRSCALCLPNIGALICIRISCVQTSETDRRCLITSDLT
jgi:hypothetical protein